MNKLRILALALVALTASISEGLAPRSAEAATGLCEAEILAAARAYGVPPGILHSVGLTETGRKGSLHPYALNIEGRTVFASSRSEALREFERARAEGKTLIDLGCMQINHRYHGAEFNPSAPCSTPMPMWFTPRGFSHGCMPGMKPGQWPWPDITRVRTTIRHRKDMSAG
jgi:hypothetical protein